MMTTVLQKPTKQEIENVMLDMDVFDSLDIEDNSIMEKFGLQGFSLVLSIMKIPEGFLYTTYSDTSHSTVFVPKN